MLTFLLKSTACMAILMIFYKLVLEKESIHHFKRFFLLGALLASFIIPNLVFIEYIDAVEPTINSITPITDPISDTVIAQNVPKASIFDWQLLLWLIYGLGIIGFGLRFIANLFRIRLRIKKNPKFKENFVTKVLLNESLPPHTFLNYIFLNQKQHEENSIPQEVLLHEETHAKQRHSLDILLIELVQVIFWFNPLIYLFKSSIKLNHEFLADKAVIQKEYDHSHYQNTLLSYLSNEKYQSVGIANAINYSSIKKRFTVMKTNTSKKSFVFRSLLLLPLTALLLFGFSEKREVPLSKKTISEPTNYPRTNNLEPADAMSSRSIELAGIVVDSKTMLPLENVSIIGPEGVILSKTDNRGYYHVEFNILTSGEIFFQFSISKEGYNPILQKEHWGNLQGKIGSAMYFALQQKKSESEQLSTLVTNTQNLDYESILMNYSKVEADFKFHEKMEEAKRNNQHVFIQLNGGHYLVSDSWIKLESKNDLVTIDDKTILPAFKLNKAIKRSQIAGMTPLENGNKANFAIYTFENKKSYSQNQQQSATREEMKEYNALAQKYNEMNQNQMIIKKKEVVRLKTIYGKMSKKQQADAEPFPDFPPAPPVPNTPGAPKAPLPPQSPLEHVKEMVAKGATFMLNGKEISAKKAIQVIKDNDKINIDTRDSKDKKPTVKLSVDPIEIDN
ncbi:M56 family metallopeptidase [Muricauda sp. 334s03]|uniref:M56 family metallopeptidase n=1 Tax=Flagellimonas yonaguniensis TaxID=3031325 RepID=A0ABT5Y0D8_9FLAO|nr:M56 family metallopeptidase [[Muricauda] yonaguniensis]MDF0716906.1 M56 family metallopeptidase [[Muricauda] yonaguniensis]